MIKVGVVYEGLRDTDAISILLKRILDSKGIQFEIQKIVPAHTGIIKFVKSYTRQFFLIDVLDVGIFLTDQDVCVDRDNRRRHVKNEIKAVNPTYLNFSAVGVADPHFEQWLIADQDCVKKVLRLEGSSPLPFPGLKPKLRLEKLRSLMSLPQLTRNELYINLSTELDIQSLKDTCPDFRLFVNELIRACNKI